MKSQIDCRKSATFPTDHRLQIDHRDNTNFVRTKYNPADVATLSIDASQLDDSAWLRGPGEACEVPTKSEFEH